MLRIGIGYDIHRLVRGRKLIIGGVKIPYAKGLLGHSDADVLLHAVCDALLGAMGSPDIGENFSDSSPKYKGISSIRLLKKTDDILKRKKFQVGNIDAVIIAEEPNLSGFKGQMREKIARTLKIRKEAINIKAKTNEGLDAVGKKKAIACYATVLIAREE